MGADGSKSNRSSVFFVCCSGVLNGFDPVLRVKLRKAAEGPNSGKPFAERTFASAEALRKGSWKNLFPHSKWHKGLGLGPRLFFLSIVSRDQYSGKDLAMHAGGSGAPLAQAAVACCGSLDMLPALFTRIMFSYSPLESHSFNGKGRRSLAAQPEPLN